MKPLWMKILDAIVLDKDGTKANGKHKSWKEKVEGVRVEGSIGEAKG